VKQIGNLVKQAQQMQSRIMKLQEEAGSLTARATSGGGAVTVEANAAGEILSLKIAPEAVSPDDVAMLEEMVAAAANEALRQAREVMAGEMKKLTGGMQIPGLF
jgi:DNA-binding YbaB/EbfC family protein